MEKMGDLIDIFFPFCCTLIEKKRTLHCSFLLPLIFLVQEMSTTYQQQQQEEQEEEEEMMGRRERKRDERERVCIGCGRG